MTGFDLLLRGGTVIDGTGRPGRRADVGVLGDRILAVGDMSAVDDAEVATVLEVNGRVVAPGFIDPHGHSDGSLFVDGALASHLHQGYTTQLSGNCGDTLAPLTALGREIVELSLRPNGLVARWLTFGEYLDAVEEQQLGPNVAFLVGHGTIRASAMGTEARPPTADELSAMVAEVEAALEAGAFGLSSGLIYAPGMHAAPAELEALVTASARRGGLYATHMRNESDELFASLDKSIAAVRAAGPGARLQVSHLKCGSRAVWGRAGDVVARLEAVRAEGLDVAADQYPYTAAATTLATILPPALQGLGVEACVAALSDPHVRSLVRREIARGISGWENVAADPGWAGIRISSAASRPEWAGRSLAELSDDLGDGPRRPRVRRARRGPARRVGGRRLHGRRRRGDDHGRAVDRGLHRRGGPPSGPPDPRRGPAASTDLREHGRGSSARTSATAASCRSRPPSPSCSGVPAARLGLHDRGVVREGAFADLVVFDPATVADEATYLAPARYPTGIDHVIVNGRPAILDGAETGDRPGRLLRRS